MVMEMREVGESNYYFLDAYLIVVSMGLNKKYVEHPLIWPETVEARLYQQTIAKKPVKKNTIVILPTALGKTAISALAAAHFLYNHWDIKILVMAPTRPLVLQHKGTFSKCTRESDLTMSRRWKASSSYENVNSL
jgi:superfamily II DNA or RNA helicase